MKQILKVKLFKIKLVKLLSIIIMHYTKKLQFLIGHLMQSITNFLEAWFFLGRSCLV